MTFYKMSHFKTGWFVGDFDPAVFKTDAIEIGYKKYAAGERDPKHYHKIATEYSLILSGVVQFNGIEISAGNIVKISPNEVNTFESITDSELIVIKHPSVIGDKYIVE